MPVVQGTQYATTNDLANLGLIGGVLTGISTPTQQAALIAASAIVDAKIQSKFILPLLQWGFDLVRAVCIIAAYDLLVGKGYNPATGADPNIRQRYLDTIEWLDEVGRGEDTLAAVVDSSTPPGPGDGSINSTADGFQLVTTAVRGWTDRGVGTPPIDSTWWKS
jgi:phage gp36-like protein